ncbi:MAG TPA: hypothetical protein VG603_14965 [Chitinophagales bacterium]|nr:hypothetical protein [Chitinophagales bacterium]
MKSPNVSDLLEKISTAIGNSEFPAVSKIEFDLLMQNVRQLYNELDTLRNANPPAKQIQQPARQETLQPEELIAHTGLNTNKHLLLGETAETAKEKPITAAELAETIKQKEVKPQVTPVSSINENIKHPGSLNDKLKPEGANAVHRKLGAQPLKDLIDLNKRFVLLNELFEGNNEKFLETIKHLDSLATYTEAQSFIMNDLTKALHLDPTSQPYRLFVKLIRQKFGEE